MTLTVCIPVYNQDVTSLVYSILKQTKSEQNYVQIVIIDDHSNESFYSVNRVLSEHVKYVYLDENIGRSKIRNKFLEYSESDYLLFIDCDSSLINEKYISSYLNYLESKKPDVLVGSSVYQSEQPKRNFRLRWQYGTIRESENYQKRLLNPNTSFKTNNFVISKKCFSKISFNEQLTGYGHEDTLFGFELNKNNIQIEHIDNPVLNGQLDTNRAFLIKTEEGLGNLLKVWEIVNFDPELLHKIRILRYYKRYKESIWYRSFYWLFKKPVRYLLGIGFVNMYLFDFYKLGYLIQLSSKKA